MEDSRNRFESEIARYGYGNTRRRSEAGRPYEYQPTEHAWQGWQAAIECSLHDALAVVAEREALQAKIDALMLEYCPDDMTPEQLARWGAAQNLAEEGRDFVDVNKPLSPCDTSDVRVYFGLDQIGKELKLPENRIGALLKAVRLYQGKMQGDMAKTLGFEVTEYSKIECGKVYVTKEQEIGLLSVIRGELGDAYCELV